MKKDSLKISFMQSFFFSVGFFYLFHLGCEKDGPLVFWISELDEKESSLNLKPTLPFTESSQLHLNLNKFCFFIV